MGKNYFLKLQIAKIFPVVFLFCMPGLHCRKPAENTEFRLQQVSQTPLEVTPESAFSAVLDMAKDTKNNFIITEPYQAKQVFIFNQNGEFIRHLGSYGQGSGEYTEPVSIGIRPDGEIWIFDYRTGCINVYSPDYQFLKRISKQRKGVWRRHLFTPDLDFFIMYEGMFQPFSNTPHETIALYDLNGAPLNRFAAIQPETADLKFYSIQGKNLAIDENNYIYEINPLFYQIRKFDCEGNILKTASPASAVFKPEAEPRTIINGPYLIHSKYLVVQIGKYLDIFDPELNQLAKELPFEEKIALVQNDRIYTFLWPHENPQSETEQPVINTYELKVNM